MSITRPLRAAQNLLAHATTFLRRVEASDFPEPLRSELTRELRRQFLWAPLQRGLWKARSLNNPTRLAGYEIFYRDLGLLRLLYEEIFVDGIYLFRCDADEPCILDCGANIGMSTLFFKKLYPRARIIAFEPEPVNFSLLERNVQQNAIDKVDLQQAAVSDRATTVELFSSKVDLGRTSLIKERGGDFQISVPAVQLSTFIDGKVDLLKIDIEGAEERVLKEVAEAGKLRMIDQIHLEYHHHIGSRIDTFSSMLRLLEDEGFGYQLWANPPNGQAKLPLPGTFQDLMVYCYRKG